MLFGDMGTIVSMVGPENLIEVASHYHPDPDVAEMVARCFANSNYRVGEGLTGRVIQSRTPLINLEVDIAELAKQVSPEMIPLMEKYPPRRMALFPLTARDACLGALMTYSLDGENLLDEDDVADLELLAAQASLAISNAQLVLRVEEELQQRERDSVRRNELEAQIQHAQKLESLGVLAGGIAHDFNNLLVGILGNASLAMIELAPESPVRSTVRRIEVAAQQAADLTNQMLAYSGKGQFITEVFDLSALVEEMAHLLEVSISKKVVLKYDFADTLPPLEADVSQIRQVIMNLITNASDAVGQRSGVVTISTGLTEVTGEYLKKSDFFGDDSGGSYVFVEISDTGSGINEQVRSRMFDPFFSTKSQSRGLGLAAVLGIVRGHGGAIRVYSEEGKGTSIKVLLPCSDAAIVRATGSHLAISGEETKLVTVLVADDEETVRVVAHKVLERLGHTVVLACDGREALKLFKERIDAIDLVILDMNMPHLSGSEVFQEIRHLSSVPTILTSGYNEQEATMTFKGKGLAGFLQKPWTANDLANAVQLAFHEDTEEI